MTNEDNGRRPEITHMITQGVMRWMIHAGYAPLAELPLVNGRRVDVVGLDTKGQVLIVEVKSSREDFMSDQKWQEYLPSCDQFCFAVGSAFPQDILPGDAGLLVADQFGAEMVRPPSQKKMHASARKALMLRFARKAAM